ncbi:ketopantoate reductase PanE/ApbA C terminal-domain-containing protein [Parachaetomium inaequale]|uniref:2-dehydropantoate 2-reductase n=1 Tax=Parachaetomium inaequale TaxID=2588326 RepID=A0AAN6SSM6_9PEZI|nr:ketopantoate reductase PanE/ApbA C terminal-domain-containing protein [Parachaetomium inaequale]
MDKGIHILGLGNLGKYVAYGLRRSQQTIAASGHLLPVTLIFHRDGLLADWKSADRSIWYTCNTSQTSPAAKKSRATGFRVELLANAAAGNREAEGQPDVTVGSNAPIRHLIVATKTYATAAALAPIKHRLSKDSDILFLQNGMGVTDEVSEKLFPDPDTRPTYWAGICSAGVYSTAPFSLVHAGHGPLAIGLVAGGRSSNLPPPMEENPMVAQLLNAPVLEAGLNSPVRSVGDQLRKLVINSIINPLTALFNCKNGHVFESHEGEDLFRHLLQEAGPIVRALFPDQSNLFLHEAFSDEFLGKLVKSVVTATANNTSSMLQDIQAGRRTEIDYINGYLVSQGERLGLPTTHHAAVYGRIKKLEAGHREQHVQEA